MASHSSHSSRRRSLCYSILHTGTPLACENRSNICSSLVQRRISPSVKLLALYSGRPQTSYQHVRVININNIHCPNLQYIEYRYTAQLLIHGVPVHSTVYGNAFLSAAGVGRALTIAAARTRRTKAHGNIEMPWRCNLSFRSGGSTVG